MSAHQPHNPIRQIMIVWGLVTLLYFFFTWMLAQFIARTPEERIAVALATTVAYSVFAVMLIQRVLREADAVQRQMETTLTQQHRTEQELEHRLRETLLLNRVIAAAASVQDPDTILQIICTELAQAFNLPQAAATRLNPERTHAIVVAEYRSPDRPSALGVTISVAHNPGTRYVIENRKPLAITNVMADPGQAAFQSTAKERGTVSLLIVPLMIHDQVVGTLGLDSLEPREFSPEEIAFAQNIATAASQALENAQLHNELRQELAERRQAEQTLRRRNVELDALNETTVSILNRLDTNDLLETIVKRAAALVNTEHGFLFVTDPDAEELNLTIGIGHFSKHVGFTLQRGQGLAGTVWQTGEPLAVEDYSTWPGRTPQFEWIRAAVCFPLRSGSEIIGVIGLVYEQSDRRFGADGLALLGRFGRLASLAVQNVALYNQTQQEIAERRHAATQLEFTLNEQQKLFRDVERAQTKARAVLDATTDMMVLISTDNRIVSVNQSFGDNFFALHPRQIAGRQVSEFQEQIENALAEPEAFLKLVHESAEDTEKQFTQIIATRGLKRREFQLASTPVHTRDGEFLGRLYVFHDITHEREVDRMKTEFVSMVSHELRTPLTSIKGYIDLLQAGEVGDMSDEQKEFLDIVKTNADRLVDLINDLLDISRIEAGRLELKRKAVDISKLIHQATNTVKPQVQTKQQQLVLNIAPNIPPVWGDADRITQILMNFISNAYKYTPIGGALTIAANRIGSMVRIDVQDTGIGLTPEERAQLFTKFFRAKNRATQEAGGTGLGLAITRSLVELHGGEIIVSSIPEKGSTFSFTLPLAQRAIESEAMLQAVSGKRILVVDDEPDIAKLIRRYLERAGYQVLIAHTGADAFRIAQTEHPDLVTLDILLADTDGFTVLEWFRNNPATKNIPVVLLSILADEEQSKQLGKVDYLAKPVNEQELLQHVARALTPENPSLVLVVDDDADNRGLVAHLLARAGYQAIEAPGGAEAIEIARAQHPGLILLDLRMPGMDGVTALHRLREQPELRQVPVVMMTGYPGALEEKRGEISKLDARLTLSKPFTAEQLVNTITQALNRGSQA